MINVAIALFVIAAILGLTLAIPIVKRRAPSRVVTTIHGLVAVTALVLLIIYTVSVPSHLLRASVWTFVVAALGGAVLVYRDTRLKKPGPVALVAIHALAATTGLVLVLLAVFA